MHALHTCTCIYVTTMAYWTLGCINFKSKHQETNLIITMTLTSRAGYQANLFSSGRCIFVWKSVEVHFRIPESVQQHTVWAWFWCMNYQFTKIQNTVPVYNHTILEEIYRKFGSRTSWPFFLLEETRTKQYAATLNAPRARFCLATNDVRIWLTFIMSSRSFYAYTNWLISREDRCIFRRVLYN